MKRRPYCVAVLVASFLLAAAAYSRLEARHERDVFAADPHTPYVRYVPADAPLGRVLVVHGLNSNKAVMNLLSMALADAGFEVFAIDLPGHGDSTAAFDGLRARRALAGALDALGADAPGGRLAVIGHSLGAALILDLANERPLGDVVLLSPAPTPVGRIQARRALVFAGEYDIPRVREFAQELAVETTSSGGLVEFRVVAWTGHTAATFRPRIHREIAAWLGGNGEHARTTTRLTLLFAMGFLSVALGIALLPKPVLAHASAGRPPEGGTPNGFELPVWSSALRRSPLIDGEITTDGPLPEREGISSSVARYVAAGAAAVLVYAAIPSLFAWLGLFGVDYLIGIQFLMGCLLLACRGSHSPGVRAAAGLPALKAALASAYVIAVPGLWVCGNVMHMAWTGGRWWRIPALAAAALPFFLADEMFIRPIQPRWKAAMAALLTRLATAAFFVTGALTFNRESSLLFLLVVPIVALWAMLWLAGEVFYGNTRNPFAGALFAALVQAAILSAVLVQK